MGNVSARSGSRAQIRDNGYSGMVVRNEGGLYTVYTPNAKCVARILMPNDMQYILDIIVIQEVCRIMSIRWKVQKGTLRKVTNCSGLLYQQFGVSAYRIFLPGGEMIKIAEIETPPDGFYITDTQVLGGICKALAHRYHI